MWLMDTVTNVVRPVGCTPPPTRLHAAPRSGEREDEDRGRTAVRLLPSGVAAAVPTSDRPAATSWAHRVSPGSSVVTARSRCCADPSSAGAGATAQGVSSCATWVANESMIDCI